MKIRAYVSLAVLSFGTVYLNGNPSTPDNTLIEKMHGFNVYKKALIATIFASYFWYKQRKPTEIRCTYQDLLHGKNLRYAIPDIFPGFPEIPYKVSLVGTEGGAVKMICQKKRPGYGLIYFIEKNAKYLAKAAGATAIALGVIFACEKAIKANDASTSNDTPSLWEEALVWLVEHFAKIKPFKIN